MANALKIVFAVYALREAFVGIQTVIRFPTPRFWLWAGVSLCLVPVAWGLIRERKWAWNAAVGLTIFQLLWTLGQTTGMFLSQTLNKSTLIPVALRQMAMALGIFTVVFVLLILARRSYQTAFAPASSGTELPSKRNSYILPVALGVMFLLTGLLMLLHPITSAYSPIPLRILGVMLVPVLWAGAAVCFFERKAKLIRAFAIYATVIATAGLLGSVTLYAYFALMGILVSGVQLTFGIAAICAVAKARLSFVD
jgi:hypothetical protein